MINPLREVEVNRFILRHPRVGEELADVCVAQITDVHLGRWVKARHLRQVCEFVNAQGPDLVALTGDYVGYNKADLRRCVEAFSVLEPPTFAVLGNHDHWASTDLATRAFASSAIELLANEHRVVEVRAGVKLTVVGVDDAVTGHADPQRAFQGVDPEHFALVLNHVPSLAWECADEGGHLILSGHTHGFQFNIPRLTHALAERFGTKLFAGPYRLGEAMLYISRGLGSASWPVRIRARPEVSFFWLEPGPRPELEFLGADAFRVEHGRGG